MYVMLVLSEGRQQRRRVAFVRR